MKTVMLAAAIFAAFTTFARSATASEVYPGFCVGWGDDVDLQVDTGDGFYTYSITFSSPPESFSWPAEKKWDICASHTPEMCALLASFGFEVRGISLTVWGYGSGQGSGPYTRFARCWNRIIAPADVRLD